MWNVKASWLVVTKALGKNLKMMKIQHTVLKPLDLSKRLKA